MISVHDISKRFGSVEALHGVSLEVAHGELFGLIGADGAGKSTLYRILTTLIKPDEGQASIEGYDIVRDYRQIRKSVGYMPDRFSLYQDLTVMENLEFFASLFDLNVRDNYELIKPIFVQLAQFPNRKAGALSGGMKQKLALCCALIHRPKILLLDEPTTGVDAVSRSEFWQILQQLRDNGMTIMVSTSYMDEATLCDRVALIDHGKIIANDTPATLESMVGNNLYDASANDMFMLLKGLRSLEEVEYCYTFGATIHFVARQNFSVESTLSALGNLGLSNVDIKPAKGNIEDLFIKLVGNEQ